MEILIGTIPTQVVGELDQHFVYDHSNIFTGPSQVVYQLLVALKHLLRYLIGTPNLGTKFRSNWRTHHVRNGQDDALTVKFISIIYICCCCKQI